MTTTEDIFKNLMDTARAVDGVMQVVFGSFEPTQKTRPCVAIIPQVEDPDEENSGLEIEHDSLGVAVRIVVDETHQHAGMELERLRIAVKTAMIADPRRGGLAEETVYRGSRWLYLDADFPQAGVDLSYEIKYLGRTIS